MITQIFDSTVCQQYMLHYLNYIIEYFEKVSLVYTRFEIH